MPMTDTVDWWLQRTMVYGLAFVFTAGILGIFLWVALSVVGIARKWIPLWIQASITRQERDSKTLAAMAECMEAVEEQLVHIRSDNLALRQGLRNTVVALKRMLQSKETRERLGVNSDVVRDLEESIVQFGPYRERHERRKRELDAREENPNPQDSGEIS